MEIQEYFDKMGTIQNALLDFLDNAKDENKDFNNLIKFLNDQKIVDDPHKLKSFLYLLSNISNNHQRNCDFFNKIDKLIIYFKNDIKKNYSNLEISVLFKQNKRLLLTLVNEGILTEDKSFIKDEYFEKNKNKKLKKIKIENEFDICELIRTDSVKKFISYINSKNISVSSVINKSINETNPLLLEKQPSLIEYAAFFGSIQIFNYLRMNNAELTSSLWIYAIHGRNPDLIQLLEENKIESDDKTFSKCYEESIKCFHNEIANYIRDNLLKVENEKELSIIYGLKYCNFSFIQNDLLNQTAFFYLCYGGYFIPVKFLIDKINFDINQACDLITSILFCLMKFKIMKLMKFYIEFVLNDVIKKIE